jgi:hypothetical protein
VARAAASNQRRTQHVEKDAIPRSPCNELFGVGFESGSAAHTIRRPLLSAT